MIKFNLTALSVALFLAMSTSAVASVTSKAEYRSAKERISTTYKSDSATCRTMTGSAKDICSEEATGREKVARAELEAGYSPSREHRYKVGLAKANAAYAVAKEKCDDLSGNAKGVCRKEAKVGYVAAKANAKVAANAR
jgi:hypothetical protein